MIGEKKMRLIDADKLENDIVENITVKTVSRMLAITQGQPTVNAIPIELIEKEMKRLDDDIKWAWYYGNNALDKMEYLKMWLTIKLEDWEKENEKDI